MQDMFKGNVSMQDTHTQIMSSCKTLQFGKTCLMSLVGRHDLLKDMSLCLKMHFFASIFFVSYCWRHVYFQDMSQIWHQYTIFTVYLKNYNACEYVESWAISWKFDILSISSNLKILLHMCETNNCDYLQHSTFCFNLIEFQLNADFPSQFWGVFLQ